MTAWLPDYRRSVLIEADIKCIDHDWLYTVCWRLLMAAMLQNGGSNHIS